MADQRKKPLVPSTPHPTKHSRDNRHQPLERHQRTTRSQHPEYTFSARKTRQTPGGVGANPPATDRIVNRTRQVRIQDDVRLVDIPSPTNVRPRSILKKHLRAKSVNLSATLAELRIGHDEVSKAQRRHEANFKKLSASEDGDVDEPTPTQIMTRSKSKASQGLVQNPTEQLEEGGKNEYLNQETQAKRGMKLRSASVGTAQTTSPDHQLGAEETDRPKKGSNSKTTSATNAKQVSVKSAPVARQQPTDHDDTVESHGEFSEKVLDDAETKKIHEVVRKLQSRMKNAKNKTLWKVDDDDRQILENEINVQKSQGGPIKLLESMLATIDSFQQFMVDMDGFLEEAKKAGLELAYGDGDDEEEGGESDDE